MCDTKTQYSQIIPIIKLHSFLKILLDKDKVVCVNTCVKIS